MRGYSPQLANIHAAGFTDLAIEAARHLRMHAPAAKRIADLGCGSGIIAQALPNQQVWGLDINQQFVEMARAAAPHGTFVVGSIHDTELPTSDAVVACGEVFNYLFDDRAADGLDALLRRIHDAMVPNGVLLFDIAMPGRADPPTRGEAEGNGWHVQYAAHEEGPLLVREIQSTTPQGTVREAHRLRLWTQAEVEAALTAAGFRFRWLHGYSATPLGPGWMVVEARA